MTKKEIKILDKLWSKAIKERDKVCQMCGKSGKYLQAHHIFTRRNRTIRWNLNCGILLCPNCHTFGLHSAHQNPLDFAEFIKKRLGIIKYKTLKKLAHQTVKWQDFETIKKQLRS